MCESELTRNLKLQRKAKRILAIGGGKGGVGKSIVATSLACAWALRGRHVVLVDLDLGAANLHSYLGIRQRTPTIAEFLRREAGELESLLVPTRQDNLLLLSGAEYVPGMANPPHWMKLKLLRHIRALDADLVILDLGAGTAFNTLDFFDAADLGVVVTEPEPAAVMNAYGFIKGALFRKLQSIFRHHEQLGACVEADLKAPEDRRQFSLDWLRQQARQIAPDALEQIVEVEKAFQPALLVNRQSRAANPALIHNLMMLCKQKLGLELDLVGELPECGEIRRYLLNIPGFLQADVGRTWLQAVNQAGRQLAQLQSRRQVAPDYSDEELQALVALINELDESQLEGRSADAWKLRVYFRADEVLALLKRHGIAAPLAA